MDIYTYSEARSNLKSIIDKTINDCVPALITRKEGRNAVIMGQKHYERILKQINTQKGTN